MVALPAAIAVEFTEPPFPGGDVGGLVQDVAVLVLKVATLVLSMIGCWWCWQ